jgi:hypothetical protein
LPSAPTSVKLSSSLKKTTCAWPPVPPSRNNQGKACQQPACGCTHSTKANARRHQVCMGNSRHPRESHSNRSTRQTTTPAISPPRPATRPLRPYVPRHPHLPSLRRPHHLQDLKTLRVHQPRPPARPQSRTPTIPLPVRTPSIHHLLPTPPFRLTPLSPPSCHIFIETKLQATLEDENSKPSSSLFMCLHVPLQIVRSLCPPTDIAFCIHLRNIIFLSIVAM